VHLVEAQRGLRYRGVVGDQQDAPGLGARSEPARVQRRGERGRPVEKRLRFYAPSAAIYKGAPVWSGYRQRRSQKWLSRQKRKY
jgi:hypothetical protein